MLFPDIDTKKTEQKVIDFFNDDYERLCVMSGINIKSPILSNTPSAPPIGNSSENQMTRMIWAKGVIGAVSRAINSCSLDSQKLLKLRFIEGQERWKVQNVLHVGKYKYYYLQEKACNQFADAFQVQADSYLDNNKGDLHVYLKD